MATNDIFEELMFYSTDDKFFIESPQSKQLLVIDRLSKEIVLEANKGQIPFTASQKPIFGIVGIIHLIAGPYIILITRKLKVGTLNKQTVWRIVDTEIVPFTRSLASLTIEQRAFNEKYLFLLYQVLSTPYFYFSYSYDLTHTLQRLYYTAEEFLQMPLHERADTRFLWNQHLLRDLVVQPEHSQFCLPIIHGFISIKPCTINGEWFTWSLISRRSVYRAGTRLWMRGIDQEGYVANYVETEQIIEYRDLRSSFVQTRGSIPLFWSQEPDLRYKPPPTLAADSNHEEAFGRHCESQVLTYGRQVMVNLIDQKGIESKLQESFRNSVLHSNRQIVKDNIKYEYFDFHHECRRMRWDRLTILMERLNSDQESLAYFLLRGGVILMEQEGVFRTNCIDCLDRTNVVQSMLARRNLQDVLVRMGIFRPAQKIEDQFSFEIMFKNVWADNADIISTQYSGTGALKTDFTRTGKRTRQGMLKDGLNSAVRYVKNNFLDGDRQDSIDLFLGKYQVGRDEGAAVPCPLAITRNPWLMLFPLALFFCLLMVFASILLSSEYTSFTFLSFLFWVSMTAVATLATFSQGHLLVNRPKLCANLLHSLRTPKMQFSQ